MIPIVFINCRRYPFVYWIIRSEKVFETRTRNTLGKLIGERVLIAETGNGESIVRCSAVIDEIISVHTQEEWEKLRSQTRIEIGSAYDWKPETKVKWLYRLSDVKPVKPFHPQEGIRHGRVWMEYEGKDV